MKIKIVTRYELTPIPSRQFDWSAVTDNYDGAEDSSNRHMIGYGSTEQEAIADLERLLAEMANCEEGSDNESD